MGSRSKRLGVKVYGGFGVEEGGVIVRQRGFKVKPGRYVGVGSDHTLYAIREGTVYFEKKTKGLFAHIKLLSIHYFYSTLGGRRYSNMVKARQSFGTWQDDFYTRTLW